MNEIADFRSVGPSANRRLAAILRRFRWQLGLECSEMDSFAAAAAAAEVLIAFVV